VAHVVWMTLGWVTPDPLGWVTPDPLGWVTMRPGYG
jgi:hypothetical protein